MTKLSLRLRLIILFVIISGIFGAMAGVLSWQETKEKIDEFFDTYQIALARQLAAADWGVWIPARWTSTRNLTASRRKLSRKTISSCFQVPLSPMPSLKTMKYK